MAISRKEKKYLLSEFKNLEQYRMVVHAAEDFAGLDVENASVTVPEIAAAQRKARKAAERCRVRIEALAGAIRYSARTAHKQSDQERIAKALYQNLVLGMHSYEVGLTSSTIAKYRMLALEYALKRLRDKGIIGDDK